MDAEPVCYLHEDTNPQSLHETTTMLQENFAAKMGRASRLLVDGFDAVAAGCIDDELFRESTVLYRSPEWAQKQAQLLWDRAARAGRLPVLRKTRFLAREQARVDRDCPEHDLILCWIPFAAYDHPTEAG